MHRAGRTAALFCCAIALGATHAAAGTIEGKVQVRVPNIAASDFVVYVDDLQGPSLASETTAIIDQRGLRFIPHVLPVQVGTTVEFANSDPLAHNVFSISSAKRFNLGLYGRGAVRRVRFDRPGVVQVLCNVHQEMSAYIVVIPNPFFARTGRDGRFRIEGVPAGQHRLRCWHEELGERTHAVRVPANGTMTENFLMDRAGERDAAP